jgi:hypothetical protein
MSSHTSIAFLLLAALARGLAAQEGEQDPLTPDSLPPDAEQPAPERDADRTGVLLASALQQFRDTDKLILRGEIEHHPPEARAGGNLGGAVVIMRTSLGGAAAPFEGKVDIWRDAEKVTVITSREALPGFALYLGQGRAIARTTSEAASPDLEQLKAELGPLLDGARFARSVVAGKLRPRRDTATGEITFHGELPRETVKPTLGAGPFLAKVLEVHGTLVVSPEGELRSVMVKVTRNDPQRELMRGRIGRGIRVQIGGAPGLPREDEESDEKHDIEGGSTTYTLRLSRGEPPERAIRFKRDMNELLAAR